MAQTYDLELSALEVHQRHRRRRRTLHEAMVRPLLIHRPTPDERLLHGASAGYFEALNVLRRALEDSTLMASLRRILTRGRAQGMSDLQILERLAHEVAGGRMIIYSRAPTPRPTDTRYAAADDRDYRAVLAGPFEGSISYMYLDSRGLVSVGVGKMLPTPAEAVGIRFVHRGAGMQAASAADVTAAYLTVRGAVANRPAAAYRDLTDLELALGESDRLLNQELQRAEDGCRNLFGGWEHFPLAAQLALLDMAYNLGEGRAITAAERQAGAREQGLYQFHRLRASVAREDWLAASRECHRVGIQAARDTWTRNKFLEAAHIAPPRPEPHRALNL
jgi:GH24 family phage-related lysozyme (muramidase)